VLTGPADGDRLSITRLEAVLGNITTQRVDAVVNAANSRLAGGGGVDGAIHRAAGAQQLGAACAEIGGCSPGDAVVTSGFALPARWIIHTVGPVWRGGDTNEDALLASCYRRSLEVADELAAGSIAFPAISTGAYGFPLDRAARIAVATLSSSRAQVSKVLLVAFDQKMFDLFEHHLRQR